MKEVFVEEVNMYRITFTADLINSAREIIFIVTGKEKARIMSVVFSGIVTPAKYPVQLINPLNGTITWYLDKEASALIKTTK